MLHRLTLRGATVDGVMMIHCATQDSTFPVLGQLEPHPSHEQRIYDPTMWKIYPARPTFSSTDDGFLESLTAADTVLICVQQTINVYHQRNDLRQIVLDRPDLFDTVRYERSNGISTLKSRVERIPDISDNWDELLAALSETESAVHAEYETTFFSCLKSTPFVSADHF
jgi:hypothetical protein